MVLVSFKCRTNGAQLRMRIIPRLDDLFICLLDVCAYNSQTLHMYVFIRSVSYGYA